MQVNETISPDERMPAEDAQGYLATGRSALRAVRLAQEAAGVPDFGSILDLPCGHGRVLRWLQGAYPDAKLTASDLIREGVDFCAEAFGATPVYSSPVPTADMFAETFDLIWVGSLFTHLDVIQWDRFIDVLYRSLNDEGLLVITTHGELVAERMRHGHLYGYPGPSVTRALRTFDHSGFAFLEESQTSIDYGISISRPEWVVDRLLRKSDFQLVLFTEALWANHQDVVAVVKRPVDPDWVERPMV
jgi:cyclopropane fatty-acyl-phospholipid synthase-like methyltransferase